MSSRPTVRAVRRSGPRADLSLYVPRSLEYFADHFPRLAILPGVVQVHWAVELAREHLGLQGSFRGLRNIKFVNPVLPETTLTLELEQGAGELSFTYRDGERAFSSGRVLFGESR